MQLSRSVVASINLFCLGRVVATPIGTSRNNAMSQIFKRDWDSAIKSKEEWCANDDDIAEWDIAEDVYNRSKLPAAIDFFINMNGESMIPHRLSPVGSPAAN